jgi:hypothetical protein
MISAAVDSAETDLLRRTQLDCLNCTAQAGTGDLTNAAADLICMQTAKAPQAFSFGCSYPATADQPHTVRVHLEKVVREFPA